MRDRNTGIRRNECKDCINERRKKIAKRYYAKQRESERKNYSPEKAREKRLKNKFEITNIDYDNLLSSQGGKCAICGSSDYGNKNFEYFCIDHDHSTKKIRGLLCSYCNRALGYFKDDIENLYKAYKYLKSQKEMKVIICMAVYDTEENKRTEYTKRTFYSLLRTANLKDNKLIIIDNKSCYKTQVFYKEIEDTYLPYFNIQIIKNNENLGTAEAINKGIATRNKNQYIVKIDNDVEIHEKGWIEKMVSCFEKDDKLGVLGLKRKDLPNSPYSKEYPTILKQLPHEMGETWKIIEMCGDIIGTCQMYSPKLLEIVGYLYQPSLYGFDDVLMCERSIIAGFYNAFLPSIEIDHIDDGKNPFTDWKRRYAGIYLPKIDEIKEAYRNGTKSIYYDPFKK